MQFRQRFFLAPSQLFLLIAWGCLGPSPRSGPSLTTTGCWVPEGVLLGVSGLGAVRDQGAFSTSKVNRRFGFWLILCLGACVHISFWLWFMLLRFLVLGWSVWLRLPWGDTIASISGCWLGTVSLGVFQSLQQTKPKHKTEINQNIPRREAHQNYQCGKWY